MLTILIILSCTIVSVLSTHPAINLSICQTNDDVCVTNAVKAAYPLVLEPNETIGAKDMDPLYEDFIEGNLSILQFKMFNTTITGYKTCEVQTAKFVDNNENTLHIDLLCQKFKLDGLYDIKGQIIILPVEGNGDFNLYTNKYSLSVDLVLKTNSKDGKNYKSIKTFKSKVEPLEKITYDFKNLFNGRQDLAEIVLRFANENWKEVATEVQDPVFTSNLRNIVRNANKYLKTLTY